MEQSSCICTFEGDAVTKHVSDSDRPVTVTGLSQPVLFVSSEDGFLQLLCNNSILQPIVLGRSSVAEKENTNRTMDHSSLLLLTNLVI